MNVKISVLVICVEAIMYLLLHNLPDCTFNQVQRYRFSTYAFLFFSQPIVSFKIIASKHRSLHSFSESLLYRTLLSYLM